MMSNARFSVLQARAVSDERISNAQFRTLAALGMFGDKDGWCFPKLATLSKILSKSKPAISKDIKMLCEYGYVETRKQFREDGSQTYNLYRLIFDSQVDTEDDKNSGEDDKDTEDGKDAGNDNGGYRHVNGGLTSEVNGGLTSEVNGGLTSEVNALTPHLNAPVNAPIKKQQESGDGSRPTIYSTYESNIGLLTPKIADELDIIQEKYPPDWFEDAVKIACEANARKLSYVKGILRQWETNGRQGKRAGKNIDIRLSNTEL